MIETIDYVQLIRDIGFPIAITLYFVFKVDKTIQNNTMALQRVADTIVQCQYKKN